MIVKSKYFVMLLVVLVLWFTTDELMTHVTYHMSVAVTRIGM